jgi:hypothetical protein
MKIKCNCGGLIVDSTDYLPFKGYIIPDTQYFDFWNAIDDAIEKSGPSKSDKENACMELRKRWCFDRIWECTTCGKLYVDSEDGNLVLYSPDSNQYNGLLDKKRDP